MIINKQHMIGHQTELPHKELQPWRLVIRKCSLVTGGGTLPPQLQMEHLLGLLT